MLCTRLHGVAVVRVEIGKAVSESTRSCSGSSNEASRPVPETRRGRFTACAGMNEQVTYSLLAHTLRPR